MISKQLHLFSNPIIVTRDDKGILGNGMVDHKQTIRVFFIMLKQLFIIRDVLFEFHLKFWNTASIGIPARSLL